MRSPARALLVAVLGAGTEFLFWLSGAVIALVTMRKGAQQGLVVLLWALLPAAVLAWVKTPLVLMCLLACYVMAVVLRMTMQWSTALLAGTACTMVFAILLQLGFADYLQVILDNAKALLENMLQGPRDQETFDLFFANLGTTALAGSFSAAGGISAVCALALGRYWQASLYNPGGFGDEFRALRFKPWVALGLLGLALLLYASTTYAMWAGICLIPLLVAGIALVHDLVRKNGGARGLLVAFYFLLLVVLPATYMVCALAVVDSLIDIRRIRAKGRS